MDVCLTNDLVLKSLRPCLRLVLLGFMLQVYPADLYTSQLLARIGSLPVDDSKAQQSTYTGPGYACDGWKRCLKGVGNATMPACSVNATGEGRARALCLGLGTWGTCFVMSESACCSQVCMPLCA